METGHQFENSKSEDNELASYFREHGLFVEQVKSWKALTIAAHKPSQITELLTLTAQLPDNQRALYRSRIYTLIFTLMYGLGLRVGEVVRLQYGEIDLDRQLLVINKTKFGKTRFVPFGPQLKKSIAAYLTSAADWYGHWKPCDPVFSFSGVEQRKPLRIETISQTFHKLMLELCFNVPLGVGSPRLHCLRNFFAVETLVPNRDKS